MSNSNGGLEASVVHINQSSFIAIYIHKIDIIHPLVIFVEE